MSSLPPLVSSDAIPAAPESGPDPSSIRYSRSVRLPGFGLAAQGRLSHARVVVVGAGGLGAPVIQYLAASGVGTLGIVDDDAVDESNLQRQLLFGPAQLGVPKARAAAEWVRAQNPDVTVRVHATRLTEATAELFDDYDLVVDGSDSFDTCYVVSDAAAERGLPVVWGSVSRFDGQVSVFWDAAPDGRGVDYRDLHPSPPASGWDESCADVGVLSPLCGLVGSTMASEVVKLVTGVGEPLLGRVVTVDAAAGSWRESRLRRAPDKEARRRASIPSRDVSTPGAETAGVSIGADVTADDLATRLAARGAGTPGADFVLLDVREPDEHDFAHIAGDVVAPGFGTRTLQRPDLDRAVPVVTYCARGPRARAAAELLAAEGYDVRVLHGGMLGWTLAGRGPAAAAG
ncbi:ThiF family adenylyltransferase [Frigoribacterium sp. 2-23]|uniref:ThiF family adenylyltransferase n=1 Tax=Frigoribacterium sp. 2-23 TaxID=3415006 RepID=UPI003C6FE965